MLDHRYSFSVGNYDKSQPLVIDPAMLIYCGYIGGTDEDSGKGIAVDSSGNAYVTGTTYSNATTQGFPATVGPDTSFNGTTDAFVTKVNASVSERRRHSDSGVGTPRRRFSLQPTGSSAEFYQSSRIQGNV